MFDSQKVTDANFIVSFDTPYTDLCDEIVREFETIIDDSKGSIHYMKGTESNSNEKNRKDESLIFNTSSPNFHKKINDILAEYTPKYGEMFPSFNMHNHTSYLDIILK